MLYLYDEAICEDLKNSFNKDVAPCVTVKSIDTANIIGITAQLQNDEITLPIVAVVRDDNYQIDQERTNFTLMHNFRLVIAYHTQGQEIYWQFQDYNPPQSFEIGQKLSEASGYKLADTPYNSSFAGYKDWFIQTYNRPGYTIEAGIGENPLPISQFDEIYNDNIGILILGAI